MSAATSNPAVSGPPPERTLPSGEGHRSRLRERFLRGGLKGFLDYEIVELLLTLGTPRLDCKETARRALERFGSWKGVIDAPPELLREVKGLGAKNIFGLVLVREAAREYLAEKAREKPLVGSPQEAFDYLRSSLSGRRREVFTVLYLNNANRVLAGEELFSGTVDQATVHPREVIVSALKHNASRLVFAHNHTGGTLRPSREDIEITARLKSACAAVGIEVLDHVIVGEDGCFSLRENGLM
jgi:DNA repair protein RadC